MLIRSVTLASAVVLATLTASPLQAQYLYMDSNGNGVHDSGDRVKKKGVTAVDIYLVSNANRDGSVATCDSDPPDSPSPTPMQVFSFSLAFKAVGGTVSWGDFTRFPTGFAFIYTVFTSDTEHHFFYSASPGVAWLEPGNLYLGRLEVQVLSGSPSIEFEPTIVRPDGFTETTSFGTPCFGIDFDYTYKLGSDFHDTDGLAAPGSPALAGGPAVIVSPNPMNPTAKFAFETTRPGQVRVRLFDLSGRLVRTVADASSMPAGRHELTLDGRNERGGEIRSGVYFYRLESVDGVATGRVTISR
jgi:hypothetical protein